MNDVEWREVLQSQWRAIRPWLDVVLVHQDCSSVLTGWTVGDVAAHLGRSITAATKLVETQEQPLSLYRYVSGYVDGADEIAADARRVVARPISSLLASLDAAAEEGFAAIAAIRAPVVRGPRGPIRATDFVISRVIELVVHADDLARSLPAPTAAPVLGVAVDAVARAMAEMYRDATGDHPIETVGLEWIRRVTGRVASDDPRLPLL